MIVIAINKCIYIYIYIYIYSSPLPNAPEAAGGALGGDRRLALRLTLLYHDYVMLLCYHEFVT